MEYFDTELLEARRSLERKSHTTLETGIYAGDDLIEFAKAAIPNTNISLWIPRTFVPMPLDIKKLKYPSVNAPEFIQCSLDTLVNIGFSLLPVVMEAGDINGLSQQFETAITNVNPSIKIQNQNEMETSQGNPIMMFDFCGYGLDGQIYNKNFLIQMRKTVFHGIFNCAIQDKNSWEKIADLIFNSVEEAI